MQVYDISNQVYYGMTHKTNQPKTFREEFAAALPASIKQVQQAETGGEALGFTMIPEEGKQVVYGMSAMLSEKSTTDNPIVQIRSNLNGENKVYSVEINKINPQHASQMEMFALCSYADYAGEGTGSTFGSYHTLRMMQDTAETSGVTPTVSDGESAVDNFMNAKRNWISICTQASALLKESSEMSVRDLFLKGRKLTNFLERQEF